MTNPGARSILLNRWIHRQWTPLVILLAALVIRLLAVGSRSLWGDEAYSWYLAGQSWADLWADGGNDPHHPPLYYAVLHLVMRISDSEAALRIPSVIASSLTVGFAYLTARRLSRRRVAILAMVLVALSPMDVWYAQDARQAATGAMLLMISAYGVSRRDPPGWIIASAGVGLSLFTHYVTALIWTAVLGILFALDDRREFVKAWLIASVTASFVFIPLQGNHFVEGFADLRITTAPPALATVMDIVGSPLAMLVLGSMAGLVVGSVVRWSSARFPQPTAWLLVVGFAAITLFAPVPRLYTLKRIVVVAWPLAVILISFAIVFWLSRRAVHAVVVGAVALSFLTSMISVFGVEKDDWRSAVATINAEAAPDDVTWVVVFVGPWGDAPYLYYGVETPLVNETDPDRYPELAASISGDIWIVASRSPRDPVPSSSPEAWLEENWELVGDRDLHRLKVRRYSPP